MLAQQRLQGVQLLAVEVSELPEQGRRLRFIALLEAGQRRRQVFAGAHRVLDQFQKPLEAQMERQGGKLRLRLAGKPLGGHRHTTGESRRLPRAVTGPGAQFHVVARAGSADVHVAPGIGGGNLYLHFHLAVRATDVQCVTGVRRAHPVDIPIGEQPVRVVGHEINALRAVSRGQFAQVLVGGRGPRIRFGIVRALGSHQLLRQLERHVSSSPQVGARRGWVGWLTRLAFAHSEGTNNGTGLVVLGGQPPRC